jgi:hypothetical protein
MRSEFRRVYDAIKAVAHKADRLWVGTFGDSVDLEAL